VPTFYVAARNKKKEKTPPASAAGFTPA